MQGQNIENKSLAEANASDKEAKTTESNKKELLICDLGWSETEIKETYYRLLTFKEDWEALGMEAYDKI